ncbi:Six-bladed beta-propeller, TolB-like,Major royal jelly protein/protein yellow [Cinara cedri]|uniref:Six-bladed beta-propeller, TolB-like,Major royal jelly protein/protein yellow n=1 Tax=Cinara cedri TaxID=506608 RepID=A0A5E4N056_9HEMI|nr:Six-bladed beta-propeller, TolB-like,Major royal jelly protein/protein yellow [Cinara cedri]
MRLQAVLTAAATALWCLRCSAWNVTRLYGIGPAGPPVRLTDVAVWRNRAYACWPRLDASQPVTLLELPWPETTDQQLRAPPGFGSAWKPRGPFRADQQELEDCRRIQSAVAIDLDKIRWHLYVLDSGGYEINNCRPKIIVYDLKTYKRVRTVDLDGLNGWELSALVVDARPFKGETRAYAGNTRGGYLAVIDPDRGVWHRLALQSCPPVPSLDQERRPQNSDGVTEDPDQVLGPGRDRDAANEGDRDAERTPEERDVPAECVAVSRLWSSVFFTSARSHDLYSASFRDLRNLTSYINAAGVKNGDVLPRELQVYRNGVKLGSSSGLYADIQGGLNYVFTRDFVAVRSSPGVGSDVAENHRVLLQSCDLLPEVTKIFTDNANYLQVWALNAVPNGENRHSVKINKLNKF